MIVIQIAWLLLSLWCIVWAARIAIEDCRQRGNAPTHRGSSWAARRAPSWRDL